MKEAIQLNVSFDQVLKMVKKLPVQQKIKLSKTLQKDAIDSKLTELLTTFKTNDLSIDVINEEVELVRQKLYEAKKH